MNQFDVDVLVVGGGTGGTAAALQAARRGANTILVTEFPWLGGMLTSAGVSAPDGNELLPFQTGLWGAFLREVRRRHPAGLDWGWVSFFNHDPRIGAAIWADWVRREANLRWIWGDEPLKVLRTGDRISGVEFADFVVTAQIIIDGTELGDILALGEVPHRWGWEFRSRWDEPSAPPEPNSLTQNYPVQDPTWVVLLRDFGEGRSAPEIPPPPGVDLTRFEGAWDGYTPEQFLNYGRLPNDLIMLNWPHRGNDYGVGCDRAIASGGLREAFWRESLLHAWGFAHVVQRGLGRRYGLAEGIFPHAFRGWKVSLGLDEGQLGAFALHPYYRESRRLRGVRTVTEWDILPISGGRVAALPVDASGSCEAIAIGNYPNDHHYTGGLLPVKLKLLPWGGRPTGTPFAIPYGALIPEGVDGLLAADKNLSVSHVANGATRLQPVVLGIGQAAGMAAALCVERGISPRMLPVRSLQEALLADPEAPAALVPLFNVTPDCPDWLRWQRYYLECPQAYPAGGEVPGLVSPEIQLGPGCGRFRGTFHRRGEQDYTLAPSEPESLKGQVWAIVTLHPRVDRQLQNLSNGTSVTVWGRSNGAGRWLLAEAIDSAG
ncbi:FAD-dependent oxidoreductase [Lyngbya sp. CCY1209]|uniref:FAD-dependent oxidoreductase n=1 Tax=Lyngbya sp. CCY1209 TaxID=2886103 RepID=UPI002D20CE2B|nr:FAD-dependent oxidoreductase [Lyngbya sp. CCY1209]MEB3883236.1 FAD-dependent oxidoreductase [Lyngbya sp. CCY1209]